MKPKLVEWELLLRALLGRVYPAHEKFAYTPIRTWARSSRKGELFDCQVRQVKHKECVLGMKYPSLLPLFTATNNKLRSELLRSFPARRVTRMWKYIHRVTEASPLARRRRLDGSFSGMQMPFNYNFKNPRDKNLNFNFTPVSLCIQFHFVCSTCILMKRCDASRHTCRTDFNDEKCISQFSVAH